MRFQFCSAADPLGRMALSCLTISQSDCEKQGRISSQTTMKQIEIFRDTCSQRQYRFMEFQSNILVSNSLSWQLSFHSSDVYN